MTPTQPIILASQSPRRRKLLTDAGYDFVVVPPGELAEARDDTRGNDSSLTSRAFRSITGNGTSVSREELIEGSHGARYPAEMVMRLARRKAEDVAVRIRRGIVIGCDTVVACRGRILGKPVDEHDAGQMLRLLRGGNFQVFSGLCLREADTSRHAVDVDITELAMETLTDTRIEDYLASGQWQGKAGAFGYQDGHDWLRIVTGSESNVIGLPLELLERMLSCFVTAYLTVMKRVPSPRKMKQ